MTLLLTAPPLPLLLAANVSVGNVPSRRIEVDVVTHSDALTFLKTLPSESVNCIVTSPPYFGLRDYGTPGQWGLEATPAEHVARMVTLFREARRVLRDDGVLWLNYGDSYAQDSFRHRGGAPENNRHRYIDNNFSTAAACGLPSKNLLGMPWRVAFGLQDDGWILRSDIIWSKPNPMPESVTDRPTKAHEYIFLFSKSQRYWYDQEAVRENCTSSQRGELPPRPEKALGPNNRNGHSQWETGLKDERNFAGRNLRTVWTIATEPTPFAHFATFPQKLVERCILAGCPARTCATCGKPWVREVEARGGTLGKSWHTHEDDNGKGMSQYSGLSGGVGNAKDVRGNGYLRVDKGFQPTCTCHADTVPGLVLDPFMGSGTVALVARRLGRHYIGSDLNPEYIKLCNSRLAKAYTLPLPLML